MTIRVVSYKRVKNAFSGSDYFRNVRLLSLSLGFITMIEEQGAIKRSDIMKHVSKF